MVTAGNSTKYLPYEPLTRYVKLWVAHAPVCWKRFPRHRLQRKPQVNDPCRHPGTCITHMPWCMSGSLTRSSRENVPGIPGACGTRKFTYLERCPCHKVFRFKAFSVNHVPMIFIRNTRLKIHFSRDQSWIYSLESSEKNSDNQPVICNSTRCVERLPHSLCE